MRLDNVEMNSLNIENFGMNNHYKMLHQNFDSKLKAIDGNYSNIDSGINRNIQRMLGIDDVVSIETIKPTLMDATKQMLYGVDLNGFKSMGLNDLSKWKLDPASEYYYQNLRQQSGYAAEIISTYKENLVAKANGSGLTTFRADDLPDEFPRNDQFVDKVRKNSNGEIVERIQTKFVGKNGDEWLAKMMSSKFEKYLDGEHVDKLECPKDYYDDVKAAIPKKIENLQKQLERVTKDGKNDVAEEIQKKIDKLKRIDEMVEQSNTTTGEAMYARLHPKSAAAKIFTKEAAKLSNKEGLKSGALAAGITFTVSAVDNISSYINGEISAEEMVKDITTETAAAGALGYGTTFISTAVSQTMKASSSQLLRNVGGSCLPAAAVSFVVESYDSISNFAQGEITGGELAYDLGENAVAIAGGIKGAAIGASIGSVAGPVGTVAGSVVGGVLGCVVTSEIYATAVEIGAEGIEIVANQAEKFSKETIELIKESVPDKVEDVKMAFNDFIKDFDLPFSV